MTFSFRHCVPLVATLLLSLPTMLFARQAKPAGFPDEKSTPPATSTAVWMDSKSDNGIVYFLFASPTFHIERLNMQESAWMDSISLPEKPYAFAVDSSGIYLSYADRIARLPIGGGAEVKVLDMPGTATGLLLDGNVLYIFAGKTLTAVNKSTGQELSTKTFFYLFQGFSIAPSADTLFARDSGVSPSDIHRIPSTSDGIIGDEMDSPYHGDYPDADKTYVTPDEAFVIDNSGQVYNAADLTHAGSLAGGFTDLAFSGNQPLVIRGKDLVLLTETYGEAGRITLPPTPRNVVVSGSSAFVFYAADTRGVWGMKVGLDKLKPLQPGSPVNPSKVSFTPDAFAYGDGIIFMLSRLNRSVFRWSVSERAYLPTIPLAEVPSHIAYCPANMRLYTAYSGGKICYFPNGVPGTEVHLTNLPLSAQGLAAADDLLFAADGSGAWATHYTIDEEGALLSSVDWNYLSAEYIWSSPTRKMYFFRDGSPKDLIWEEIAADGTIGTQLDTPYHDSEGFVFPIRVSPEGGLVVLGSGRIFDGTTLEHITTLTNSFTDAVWAHGAIYSIRYVGGGTQVQAWSGAAYSTVKTKEVSGAPRRIFETSDGLVIVTIFDGKPFFVTLSPQLEPVTSSPLPRKNSPPRISIVSPIQKATVSSSAPVRVTISAIDENGIEKVELFDKKTLVGTLVSPPYLFNLDLTAGKHTLKAVATDSTGKKSTDSVKITVK